MAMLAEPRSKQKWSDDPRNTRWSNDKTKFGYQMLSKMGWSEGKGLGSRMSGNTSHVKVTKKRSVSGLGSTQANDDNWIAHQDDFNALLGALNQKTSTTSEASESKIGSLEDRVKNSKKKIMYHKFVKSKDLSRASSHDLACIFGQRSKSAPNTPQISDDEAVDSDASTSSCPPVHEPPPPSEHGIQTTTSSCNMHEYFARKMAALQQARIAKLMQDPDEEAVAVTEELQLTEENVKLECRKKKKSKNSDTVVQEESDPASECTTDEIKKKKKKKRKCEEDDEKKVTFAEENNEENIAQEVLTSEVKKKSKKKKKLKVVDNEEEVSCETEQGLVEVERKKNKKKKKAEEDNDDSINVENSELNGNIVDTQGEGIKKKKKKKQVEIERDDNIEIVNSELNLNCVEENEIKKKKTKKRKHSKELSEEEVEHKVKKKKKKKHVEDVSGE